MRISELLRLVWINLTQNKFKVILTSIGIVVGATTIIMVIAIGSGSKKDIAEQFKNLNAGAIDISYGDAGGSTVKNSSGEGMPDMGGMGGGMPNMGGGRGSSSGGNAGGSPFGNGMPDMNFDSGMFGNRNGADNRMNQEKVTLTQEDMDDIATFVPDIVETSISYTTKQSVDGGELEEAQTYTIAGVLSNYAEISNLSVAAGEFLLESNEENTDKVCVLGASTAIEIFGSLEEAYDSVLYIDNRPYVVNGILEEVGTVASGISPDEAIFIPYATGIKYITGENISPTLTVIAEDVDDIATVEANIESVLAETYPNTEFTITDAGSKMEAAAASNKILQLLLIAMAAIVFIVGGIGIMNVLFVTVKERTKEIGILKSMGCSKKDILLEFLFEACSISIIGGLLGIAASFIVTPVAEYMGVRVELSVLGAIIALGFAVLTGTVFGFYPAYKASNLIPIEALSEE